MSPTYLDNCVDDVSSTGPSIACISTFSTVMGACDLLGFRMELRMDSPPPAALNSLGAAVSFGNRSVVEASPAHRKLDLAIELAKFLVSNRSTPWRSAKLRGNLGLSQSLLFGRMGRFPSRTISRPAVRPLPCT